MRGAIVLAGGASKRLGTPKPLVRVDGIPLVERVVTSARAVCGEVVVATRSSLSREIRRLLPGVRVEVDRVRIRTPLAGLLTGSRIARSPYVAAVAGDHPFVEPEVLATLFAFSRGRDAAVPRWPDGRREPLLAVYRRASLARTVKAALASGERSNQAMLDRLRDVRYVRPATLFRVDRRGLSFLNVNTPGDLARARRRR